ncbi:hypothetical protein FXO38_25370 [Capsicum annuum]|nr:hypothetical protein FXO38_25370 [Capsicum annuum]KAF3636491.1 hypothetical protein FXO37_25424 [Capsicum annuum]
MKQKLNRSSRPNSQNMKSKAEAEQRRRQKASSSSCLPIHMELVFLNINTLKFSSSTNVGERAKNLTKGGNIEEFADPKLEGKFSTLVFKLALSSIGLKQQRPSMELEEALDLSTRIESVHP